MTLVPSKTKLLPVYSKNHAEDVKYAEIINTVKIAGKLVTFADDAEHVGVIRTKAGDNFHLATC